jgi:phosphohistidine phosphatase
MPYNPNLRERSYMELYIIRHAEAQQLGQKNNFTDEKRALTSDGKDRMRDGIKGLRKLGVEPGLVLTSPLTRAVETAEIVAAGLGLPKKEIVQTDNLKPGAQSDALLAEIKKHAEEESMALVGHEPDLGGTISEILNCGILPIDLKKGSVCCISITETVPALRGRLRWILTLKQLRMLSKS